MGLLDSAEQKLLSMKELSVGELRIAAGDVIIRNLLLPHLERFHKVYPQIHLSILNRTSPESMELLQSGIIDVAFVNLPMEGESMRIHHSFPIHDVFVTGQRFRHLTEPYQGKISFGLRCNPEHSEADVDLYSPCGPNSRLGIRSATLKEYGGIPDGIEGLHFHALCQRNSDALERTLAAFEEKFGEYIPGMKWVNFGGGHHITRADYDVDLLCHGVRADPFVFPALNADYYVDYLAGGSKGQSLLQADPHRPPRQGILHV
jgi:hypothetical protein